jgi:hypothetical protein
MSWYNKAQKFETIPSILFHATFNANINSIKQQGLNPYYNGIVKCWEDCKNGIYLHSDPDVASDYTMESSNPNIPEEWFDDIIALEINTSSLDISLFSHDPNLPEEHIDSFLYEGVIPFSAIRNIL